ncbi:MAG: hypothetical protein ACE5J9_02915 [Methanosarcinales archaeon]
MEIKHDKLGITLIGETATSELLLLERFCSYLEQLPRNIRSNISDVISFKKLELMVELYKHDVITLGKFSELVGLPLHDAAKILETFGITPKLGATTKEEIDREIEVARRVL